MKYYDPIRYTVGPEADGKRLDTVLRKQYKLSRRLLIRLKRTEEGIRVNGERAWTNRIMRSGDTIELRMEVESSDQIKPEAMELHILYEDDHLLVLNKPPGVVVHPTHGHYEGTIANGVLHHWRKHGKQHRFRPVHRLDTDTSGVLVVAKNPFVHQQLYEQMKVGQIDKQYTAYVHGQPPSTAGVIDAPIKRDPVDPAVRITAMDGASALTEYELVTSYSGCSELRLRLITGRTHQIRVHMLHLGCPLVGEPVYTKEQWRDSDLDRIMGRQALHASRIAFRHPVEHNDCEFVAPPPADLVQLRQHLEQESRR